MSVVDKVQTIINRKLNLTIDSSKRQPNGTAEDFIFLLPNIITDVKLVRPIYIIISNNVYNITSLTGQLTLITNSGPQTQQITPGTYDIDSLILALNTLWNPLFIDFSYNQKTLKITITDTQGFPFRIDDQNSNILQVLGFTSQYNYQTLAIQQSSDNVVKLENQFDYILINMDIVQQYYALEVKEYLISIPLTSIQFGKSELIQFPPIDIITRKSFFNQIRVYLTDKSFNPIDNNNADFIIQLEVQFL